MQTLAQLNAGIDAAAALLNDLQAARLKLLADRKAAVLRDFDAGVSRETLCKLHEMTYPALAALLNKSGRTKRTRLAAQLKPERRADYNRLITQGVPATLALSIAQTVAT